MINPYYCYVASFTLALGTYMLGWSDLYPALSFGLFLFLIITFIPHLLVGRSIQRSGIVTFTSIQAGRSPVWITIFIYGLWCLDFIYEGGVPLFKILFNQPYNYREFGVPSLHVFTVTFSSFYTIYLSQAYWSSKSRILLVLILINLAAAVLIYSRAMLFMNLTGCILTYFIYSRISIKKMLLLSGGIAVLFFVFGVFGSLRSSHEARTGYSNENLLEVGGATTQFRESMIPEEYFWAYIYASSPLANVQMNIDKSKWPEKKWKNIGKLFVNEMLPDFLSKRINRTFGLDQARDSRIPGNFNVSTIYSKSYNYARWLGMGLVALFLMGLPLLYLKIIPPQSKFFLSGWIILCSMFFFSSYDNTIRFTGLSLQLAYPILLHIFYGRSRFLARLF